jgi:Carboxypeptidase regulatory-like domain
LVELKLDDLQLVYRAQAKPTDPITELREVRNIQSLDRRNVVELHVPGAEGNILQDLGREPMRILFTGQLWGPDANATLQRLLDKYAARRSFSFSSDVTMLADVSKVMVEDLTVEETSGRSNRYLYHMTLREYREPRSSAQQAPPPQQANSTDSDMHDIRGRLLDANGDPAADVAVTVKGDAGEYKARTDSDGYYEVEDLPEGTYKITVDKEGYEFYSYEVEIQKKQSK